MLNHTSGLHNATVDVRENPLLICDWEECLNCMAKSTPETEPGQEQLYHFLSYGWLCGGIIEVICFVRSLKLLGYKSMSRLALAKESKRARKMIGAQTIQEFVSVAVTKQIN